MAHTPGPWNYLPPAHDSETGDYWVLAGNSIVADVSAVTGLTQKTGEDNARLIAAVPEFLEICEEMLYHLAHSMDCKHGNGFTYDFCPVKKMQSLVSRVRPLKEV